MRNLREWLNRNPAVAAVAAAALVILAIVVLIRSGAPPRPPYGELVYYYDLNTEALFVDQVGRETPFQTDSGPTADGEPAGVRAIVFACHDCADEADRFPAYLQKGGPNGPTLIRRLDDTTWRRANPVLESEWRDQVNERCRRDGGSARQCLPRSR